MSSLRAFKAERRAFYQSIVAIECPILGATVYFTSQGFDHLINESNSTQFDSKPRLATEQYMKLKHLAYVPDVIRKCTKVNAIRKVKKMVKGVEKDTTQYELVHEFTKVKSVRVIIEKVGDGKHKFLSVMPHNATSKSKKHP